MDLLFLKKRISEYFTSTNWPWEIMGGLFVTLWVFSGCTSFFGNLTDILVTSNIGSAMWISNLIGIIIFFALGYKLGASRVEIKF